MKWKNALTISLGLFLLAIAVLAYIPPDYDSIILELDTGYTPPDYDNIILTLGEAVPTDTCDCPSPAAHWYVSIADNCNITTNCYNDGFDVSFENGTAGDMVNISAMIVADNFNSSNAGSGAIIHWARGCYLNTTS